MGEGKKISDQQKQELAKLGEKHKLSLMVLYGSRAKGKTHKQSDVDIAVYKMGGITPEEYFDIYSEIMSVLSGSEVDVKSLHKVNPLFRYEVLCHGKLLFGKRFFFDEFRSYAIRDYHDSADLFRLQEILNRKGITKLLQKFHD